MASYIRRGLLAGLLAGLVTGAFHFWVSEPIIERALTYEVAPPGEHVVEIFSRDTQRVGLMAATALFGLSLGGIFGLLYPFVSRRLRTNAAWESSMRVALAGFASAWLVPFIKYPANPPAVGDPDTIGLRTAFHLTMIAVSIGAAIFAWMAARRLRSSKLKTHQRHLVVGTGYLAVLIAAHALLPNSPDAITIPAKLLWDFRVASVVGQALLWAVLGVSFALLTIRAESASEVRTNLGGRRIRIATAGN